MILLLLCLCRRQKLLAMHVFGETQDAKYSQKLVDVIYFLRSTMYGHLRDQLVNSQEHCFKANFAVVLATFVELQRQYEQTPIELPRLPDHRKLVNERYDQHNKVTILCEEVSLHKCMHYQWCYTTHKQHEIQIITVEDLSTKLTWSAKNHNPKKDVVVSLTWHVHESAQPNYQIPHDIVQRRIPAGGV